MDEQTAIDLELRQHYLEQESVSLGRERYIKRMQQADRGEAVEFNRPAMQLIRRTLRTLADGIDTDRSKPKTRGRYKTGQVLTKDIEAPVLAHLTLRYALSTVSSESAFGTAARKLGRSVMEELRMRAFQEHDPQAYKMTQIALEREEKIRSVHRSESFAAYHADRVETPFQEWRTDEQIKVGSYLLDQLIQATGLFHEQVVRQSRNRVVRLLLPTQYLMDWLQEAHEAMADLMPVRLPMVVPPRDWTTPWDGGYLTNLGGPISAVKSRNKDYLETLEQVDMPQVYEALNSLQATAWSINPAVLQAAQGLWHEDIAVGPLGNESMPARSELDPPPIPQEWEGKVAEWKREQPDTYKVWARKAAEAHQINDRLLSKRISCQQAMSIANRFVDDTIYFPHVLDFRGRSYPVPVHLQPQGNDLSKGLLRFAEGKELGESGAYWLKVHIANCFGVDKVSFADRVKWVDDRSDLLADSGMMPLDGERFWLKADEPFQALAACTEYVGYLIEGTEYKSRIPCGQDGSCNGLQHYSALLRDYVGGAATNLVPADKPADIYRQVADRTAEKIRQKAEAGDPTAVKLDGHISRTLVKQPVMTLPYGATINGMRRQLEVAVRKLGNPMGIRGNDMWTVCGELSVIVHESIGEVVIAAVEAMGWLQQVARIASKEAAPIAWTSPIGLPVLQAYRKYKSKPIEVHIGGKRCRIFAAEEQPEIDKRKAQTAIAPNLVHSMDASHMMLTILKLKEHGIDSFSMVHDSYGVHAGDVETLHSCLREAFVELHSRPLLEDFLNEIRQQVPETLRDELPELPETGDLDIEEVLDSPYFFA